MLKKIIYCLFLLLARSALFAAESGLVSPAAKRLASSPAGVPDDYHLNTAPKDYVVKKKDSVVQLAHPVVEKLQPMLRETLNPPLPAISTKALRNLLSNPVLMEPAVFESLAYVIASSEEGALMYSSGDTIYVKGLSAEVGSQVALYSKFRQLSDPDSHESLGYEVRYVGAAIVNQNGPVSRLLLVSTLSPVAPLDRVVSQPEPAIGLIVPHKSAQIITGKIIAIYDGLTATAEDNSVVINRGHRDGVAVGQIYAAIATSQVGDPNSSPDKAEYILLPPEVIGEILIYKVYDKVSFGLVTNSSRPVALNSVVLSQ